MSNRQSFNSDDDTSPQFTPTGTRTPVGPDASTAAAAPAVTDFQRRYRAMAATAVDPPIQIVEAGKASDGPGASFVAYTIKVSFAGEPVRRRYSEFESMRKILKRLYPHVVVPPIPEKHSLADYAKLQSKAKDDQHTIELRKRMLQSFLNRVAAHDVLGAENLFHRFLEPGAWTDVLFSQNIGRKDRRDTSSAAANTSTTSLLGQKKLKNPDLKFLEAEHLMDSTFDVLASLDKSNKKVAKRVAEMNALYSELGAVFNAFSLHETAHPPLATGIEKVGQAMDSSYLASNALLREMEERIGDQLHEYVQYTNAAKSVLRLRHQKHAHYEDLGDQIDSKRLQLAKLEKDPVATTQLQAAAAASGSQKSLGKKMLSSIGSLGDKLQQMVDNDPELTRRTQIARLKDTIAQLEKDREDALAELTKFSEQVQHTVEAFHEQKRADIKQLILAYAKMQKKWHEKNRASWQEALAEVEKI